LQGSSTQSLFDTHPPELLDADDALELVASAEDELEELLEDEELEALAAPPPVPEDELEDEELEAPAPTEEIEEPLAEDALAEEPPAPGRELRPPHAGESATTATEPTPSKPAILIRTPSRASGV
jgi:hypothetical protein